MSKVVPPIDGHFCRLIDIYFRLNQTTMMIREHIFIVHRTFRFELNVCCCLNVRFSSDISSTYSVEMSREKQGETTADHTQVNFTSQFQAARLDESHQQKICFSACVFMFEKHFFKMCLWSCTCGCCLKTKNRCHKKFVISTGEARPLLEEMNGTSLWFYGWNAPENSFHSFYDEHSCVSFMKREKCRKKSH